ncbi:MAG: hypothetical protein HRU20_12985 [Pseudomonadales bacterium]|nr:hypothetical protein [Pseudomonadales bacterium]
MEPVIQDILDEIEHGAVDSSSSSRGKNIELFPSISSVLLVRVSLFFLLFCLCFGVWSLYDIYVNFEALKGEKLQSSMAQVKEKSLVLSERIRRMEPIINQLADDLHSGALGIKDIDKRIKKDLAENTWMYGLGLSFEPYVLDPLVKLKSNYFVLGADDKVKEAQINYDYTLFKYDWYRKPLLEGKRWSEPYFGEASQELTADFGRPFWLPGQDPAKDEPSGVVGGELSTEKLKRLVAFKNELVSYYYILSKQGRFIVHPDQDLVNSGVSIFEQAWANEDAGLNSMAIHAVNGDSGYIDHLDPLTQEKSWIIYQAMKGLGWSLAVVLDKERLEDKNLVRKQWFRVVTSFTFALLSLIALLAFNYKNHQEKTYLMASVSSSFVVFLGIAAFWWAADHFPKIDNSAVKVMSSSVLKKIENEQIELAENLFHTPPKFISTGVYFQSIEFEGSNNIKITAYVWQKYKKGLHKGIERGVILPEAESPSIEKAYHYLLDPDDPDCLVQEITLRDCEETIGWYIFANLRQGFDYSAYPLDSQQVWLRLWHKNFQDNVILTPDLESYAIPNPALKPGVQEGFVLPGWNIRSSWFSINQQSFNTNFGHSGHTSFKNKPELFFNINIQRKFLTPFVSRVIPIFLVAVLMFLIILISTKSSKMSEWLGFSASDVVLGISALFFVVVINHSELRRSLQSPTIMYFEYYYFVIYIMLMYVAISSVYIAKTDAIENKDENLVSKVMYWPTLSLALFFVTYWVFY